METLYLTDNGIMLKKKSGRIAVKKDGKIIEEIPILELKRILIFGNNQVSTALLSHLAGKGIEVAYLSTNGRFRFRVVPETSKNIYLRMAQHDRYRNKLFRAAWSRSIVEAKLKNQKNLLARTLNNHPDAGLEGNIATLKESVVILQDAETVDEIMGVEGQGAKTYFEGFGRIIRDNFSFTGREYYPPPDPVNAMLSFGYMLLFNEFKSLLEAFGFDTYLGFLHSMRYGRASLAVDMIEEFRSPVIDRLVIYLINLGIIKPSDFEEPSEKGVKLKDNPRKLYLKNYEKFMTTSFVDYKTRERKNYRQVMRENVVKVERLLLHGENYEPYRFYW